jgi:hypothetical protein
MSMRDHIDELQLELLKLAEETEERTTQKCAELLLAASGLKMLENKLTKGETNV